MSIRLKPLAAVLCLSGLGLSQAFAALPNNDTKALELQLASLQREMNSLKLKLEANEARQQSQMITTAKAHVKKSKHFALNQKRSSPSQTISEGNATSRDPESTDFPLKLRGRDLVRMIREEKEYLPFDLDVPGQAFVSTGPYVGVPLQYSGSNLIVNSPSVNTDVQLLNIRIYC
jgi:hypothetical protein